ncbi:MAG TPA: class I SAM-dependent methyltransferase [Pseudonocardiaceae bacterium]|nr:class I SAM-dependent methyltransferase [Pseudonocardiaceae bacterium]
MPPHTHDGIDWTARLADLRRADEVNGAALRSVAERLLDSLPAPHPTILDVGSGAGGMSAALAETMVRRAGSAPAGRLVLVDAVPELLAAAASAASTAAGSGQVDVRTVCTDLAGDPAAVADVAGDADLVWASNVAHHVPDQRQAVATLAGWLGTGGCLALAEGGLAMRCLPWDVGVGEPGLQSRLLAAQETWFYQMRAGMDGVVRLPVGWNRVLTDLGLSRVTAFSYLVDVPAPLDDTGRAAVVSWLGWLTSTTCDLLDPADLDALHRLADPADPAYVGHRDDVFLLNANTVHLGWRT